MMGPGVGTAMSRLVLAAAHRVYAATPFRPVRRLYAEAFVRLVRGRRTVASVDGLTYELDLGETIGSQPRRLHGRGVPPVRAARQRRHADLGRRGVPGDVLPGWRRDRGVQEDLVDKLRYDLEHDHERREIALRGYRRVMKDHQFRNRMHQAGELVRGAPLAARAIARRHDLVVAASTVGVPVMLVTALFQNVLLHYTAWAVLGPASTC